MQFSQFKTNGAFATLNDWVNLQDRSAEYSTTELVTLLTDYGYTFTDDTGLQDADFSWYKRKTDDSQEHRVSSAVRMVLLGEHVRSNHFANALIRF